MRRGPYSRGAEDGQEPHRYRNASFAVAYERMVGRVLAWLLAAQSAKARSCNRGAPDAFRAARSARRSRHQNRTSRRGKWSVSGARTTFEEFLLWERETRDTLEVKRIYVDMAGDLV